jgi:hypothetical protein
MKRARHSDQSIIGGVVPLARVRTLVELTPVFGDEANRHLAKENILQYCTQFWLDKYFDKELFYPLTLGQT